MMNQADTSQISTLNRDVLLKPLAAQGVVSPTFSPLYQQIKQLILRGLEQGEWRPGTTIPSENDLAARFGVSQGTVRKAIDDLANDHILVRRQGKGTFVATHHEARAQVRFLRLVPDDGKAEHPKSNFVEFRRARAPAEIARQLEIKSGDSVFVIRRTLEFRDRCLVIDDIWLPASLFRGLTAERLAAYSGPMYALFEQEFDTKMLRADERIKAVAADEVTATLLGVPFGTPLLSVDRVSYTYGDRPVEVRKGLYLTEDYHYHNELN